MTIKYIRCKIKNIGVKAVRNLCFPIDYLPSHLEAVEYLPNDCIRIKTGDTWCLRQCFECR